MATKYCDGTEKKGTQPERLAVKIYNTNSMYYLLKRHVKASVFSL